MYGWESSTIKKADRWRIEAFELWCYSRLLSTLNFLDIQPVNPKGNQSWIFIRRTNAEAQTPILWPPDVRNWLTEKDPHAGEDWRWEEKGTTEDEMVGWHHQLNGHEFESAPEVGDGQGSLASCNPQGCKELDMTEPLNRLSFLNDENLFLWATEMRSYLTLNSHLYRETLITLISTNVIGLTYFIKCSKF